MKSIEWKGKLDGLSFAEGSVMGRIDKKETKYQLPITRLIKKCKPENEILGFTLSSSPLGFGTMRLCNVKGEDVKVNVRYLRYIRADMGIQSHRLYLVEKDAPLLIETNNFVYVIAPVVGKDGA